MKLGIGLIGAWALGVSVLCACSGTEQSSTDSTDLATMVAALSVNSDGTDASWSDATDPEPVRVPGCGFEHIVSKVVEHYDTNGDGSLSATERAQLDRNFGDEEQERQAAGADAGAAAPQGHPGGHGRVALLISLYDTNGDGTLDATEIAALKADIDARCQTRLAKLVAEFDTNGDGTLDATEWKAAEAALHSRFDKKHGERVQKLDTNGDGKISDAERLVGRAAADQTRDDAEKQFDADGDGKLGDSEKDHFRVHARECVRDDLPMMSSDTTGHDTGSTSND